MIYVEGKPDNVLVRHATGIQGRNAVRSLRGRGEVCRQLMRTRNQIGMVDEDPGDRPPDYFRELDLRVNRVALGLKLYRDRRRNNRLVVLCPKLEDWLLRAARDAGLRMADYGLPSRSNRLHDVINADIRKLQRLLNGLSDAGSPRLNELRRLLTS